MAVDLLDLMELEDNVVSDDINEYSITLYGQGGSGKSTFANALKRKLGTSVSFFFEPRARGLGGIKVVECPDWVTFTKYIKQLKKLAKEGKKVPFNNIIIDSVDSAYDKCTKSVMEQNGWETLTGDYGARYTAVGSEFKNAISSLRELGFIVTFLTHEKTKEAHDVDNAAFEKSAPIVSNQIQDIVNDHIDFIMYLEKVTITTEDDEKKEIRRLWLKNNPYMTLKTPLFGLPDYIEYEYVNEGVDKFIKAFDKAVKETRGMYAHVDTSVETDFSFAPKVEKVKEESKQVEVASIESDELPKSFNVEVDIEELRKQAIATRDKLMETMETEQVKEILRNELGKLKIANVDDVEALKAFIKKYE